MILIPKARLVHLPPVPLYKLIQENTESQALALDQQEKLDLFEEGERHEDQLKAWLKSRVASTSGAHREDLARVLAEIEAIDALQDPLIEDVRLYSEIIRRINWKSNGLLKFFDVKGPYVIQRSEIKTPLFGVIKRRWKREKAELSPTSRAKERKRVPETPFEGRGET